MPTKLRNQLLKGLHDTHEGMVKMNCYDRAYFGVIDISTILLRNVKFRPELIESKAIAFGPLFGTDILIIDIFF